MLFLGALNILYFHKEQTQILIFPNAKDFNMISDFLIDSFFL